jgi:hypothetical protein
MGNYYLKTITVPIPIDDKLIVIRKGERVEYEIDRIYSPEEQNTRVKRKVIGKVDPVQPGRMFPNEFYFELFPDNEVPEEIRVEFLRECEIKRQMKIIRRSPEEVVDHVVRGLYQMSQEEKYFASADATRAFREPGAAARSPLKTSTQARFPGASNPWTFGVQRRVFDEIYYAIEELAEKYPNEKIEPFKVERINEVLEELRGCIEDERIKPFLRLIEEGLSYSDVMILLKWYKVLPR